MNESIFREYDIRGVAERDFDAAFARRLGHAYAQYLREAFSKPTFRVAVGRDCRLTSEPYAAALREGLRESGLHVIDVGVCPTPLLYFSLFELDLDGGIQVTGSHNPADQNGFKICAGKTTIHGEQIQRIRALFDKDARQNRDGSEEHVEIVSLYLDYLARHFTHMPLPLPVVVDAGNATAGSVAPAALRRLGCTVDELYCETDGRFPNHHPDPTVPENLGDLIARVRATGAMLGIGFDGDADRIGVVDRHGRVVWGDELLILFARDVLAARPGATIVSEVKCTQRLFEDIAAHGGRAIMWKAGHSPIKAKMRETNAALGGEMSGHMFFADRYFGYDDAIYAACRLVEILSKTGMHLDELLADLPPAYNTPEIRLECPDAIKFEIAARACEHFRARYEVVDIDGVRVKLPHGWGLLRASNTQPAIVLRLEADSPAMLEEYRLQFKQLIADLLGQAEHA